VEWSAHDTATIANAVYPGNTAGTLDLSRFMSPDPVSADPVSAASTVGGWLEDPLCPRPKTPFAEEDALGDVPAMGCHCFRSSSGEGDSSNSWITSIMDSPP
jgi:hypothetical protein